MKYLNDIIVQGDHREVIENYRNLYGELATSRLIKLNMYKILEHYIGCTWGACYNSKFNDLIKPFFDDPVLLNKILRSNLIKERSNVITGKTGARIFHILLYELRKCNCLKIRDYLFQEFE